MTLKNYKFKTATVTICEPNRFERLFDGVVEKIPSFLMDYTIVYIKVNPYIDNTYLEVDYVKIHQGK